jgi:hypothetical protein
MKWIRVEDRLPEHHRNVLVFYSVGLSYSIAIGVIRDTDCGELWFYLGDSSQINHHITHWMPLPEPPEELL